MNQSCDLLCQRPALGAYANHLLFVACLQSHCSSVDPGPQGRSSARALPANGAYTILTYLGLTPATERWDGRPSEVPYPHHPHTTYPRCVDFVCGATSCTGQRSALVADQLWAIPETRRSGGLTPVACTCAPADPAN